MIDFTDIIDKKKNKKELTKEEIFYAVNSYTNGDIPDYQMSALLMAILLNGMTNDEVYYLTEVMMQSGDILDLSRFNGMVVDKHSTGGIGDKTTIILGPILAALGCKVAKISGRGLGITGGTADKLESIEGYNISLSQEEFLNQIQDIGISLSYNIGNLAPADKKIYALRDVTATVDSIPLIASSIMSKKLASGADAIVLDVKVGKGAFMKDINEARKLAKLMIEIGKYFKRKVRAVLTNMDIPLGHNIGNKIEIEECVEVLQGKGEKNLKEVTICLAANLLNMVTDKPMDVCNSLVKETLENGLALNKFNELVNHQHGNLDSIYDNKDKKLVLKASMSGYLTDIDSELIGHSSMAIKVGRETKEEKIDYDAGIKILKSINDEVNVGDEIAIVYYKDGVDINKAISYIGEALKITPEKITEPKLIYEVIE